MNDWGIGRFLAVALGLQAAVWLVVAMESAGVPLPFVRQATGFVYVAFLPGIVILRALRMHDLGSAGTLLYAVGLSLATVMFAGALANTVYPLIGIPAPISLVPLLGTLTAVVLALCLVAYVRDRAYGRSALVGIGPALSPPALFLYLLPLLSVIGTHLVNVHQSNVLMLVLLGLIGLTVVLVGFNRFFPRSMYPLAVFCIGLALLFSRSLISGFISGSDIHEEYFFAGRVLADGLWTPTYPSPLNAMLSITILAPASAIIEGISLTWVFKAVYPLVFAVAQIGLYRVFRRQMDHRMAFLACFFFMSVSHFYTGMAVLLRQQMATLFLVMLVLLMVDREPGRGRRSALFVVFGGALAVSHYGLSYIYMFYLIAALLILRAIDRPRVRALASRLPFIGGHRRLAEADAIGGTAVMLYVALALTWYMSTSGSIAFEGYVYVGRDIVANMVSSLLSPESSHGLALLLTQPKSGLLHGLNAVVNYLNQIFIVVGVALVVLKARHLRLEKAFAVFAVLSLAIAAAGVVVPFLTLRVDMQRLYHIALIFLAPLCVGGGMAVFALAGRAARAVWPGTAPAWSDGAVMRVLAVYFAVFFLFESGAVWQITEDYAGSVSLSQGVIEASEDARTRGYFRSSVTPGHDVAGARWLAEHMTPGEVWATYSDAQVHPLTSYGMVPRASVPPLERESGRVPEGDYVYLQYLNVVDGIGTSFDTSRLPGTELSTYDMVDVMPLLASKGKVYTNGGSEVYR